MKKFTSYLLAIAAMSVITLVVSCKKDNPESIDNNPPVKTIASAPFSLNAVEFRNGKEYPWIIYNNGATDSVKEEIDDMYVTSCSTVTVYVSPETGESFPGFNVRSSNTKAVEVFDITENSFRLCRAEIPGGSQATIEVWNGNGTDEYRIAFQVNSCQMIEPTAFVFLVDGQPVEVPLYYTAEEGRAKPFTLFKYPERDKLPEDIDAVHKIVAWKTVPENCTYEKIRFMNMRLEDVWVKWLEENGFNDCGYSNIPLIKSEGYFECKLDELNEYGTLYTSIWHFGMLHNVREWPMQIELVGTGSKYAAMNILVPFDTVEEQIEWMNIYYD